MTPGERDEYDELMLAAGTDSAGKPLPSHEIGVRVYRALHNAAHQAHREWAEMVLDEIFVAGCLKRWKDWNRGRAVITVAGETYVTTKAAAMSVLKHSGGRQYFQLTFWEDMSRGELEQVVTAAAGTVDSARLTMAIGNRLLKLFDNAPGAKTVRDAAAAQSIDIDDYLSQAS